MVFGLSKEEREERKHQRQLDDAANRLAEQARRDARRSGRIKGATKRGYKEGYEQGKTGGGGFLGKLEGAAKVASKHIEIGPRKTKKGEDELGGLGFREPNASDFSLGFGTTTKSKGKKKDIYDEYGL